jgi:hypothetical protein
MISWRRILAYPLDEPDSAWAVTLKGMRLKHAL